MVAVVTWAAIKVGAHLPWLSVRGWRVVPVLVGIALWARRRRVRAPHLLVGAAVTGLLCGAGAWWQVTVPDGCTDVGGELTGRARVVSESRPRGRGQRAVIQIAGVRVEAIAFGPNAARLARLRHGENVSVAGACRLPPDRWRGSLRSVHVVATLVVAEISEPLAPPSPLARSVNRVHDALRRGARSLPPDDRELFLGLVVGADDRQPRAMVDDFRASGLGHLTAVSGQNVAYVLTLVGAVGLGTAPRRRVLVVLAALIWFALLTRMEPSVVRATGTAVLAAAARAVGSRPSPMTLGTASVVALLLVDPMLAHSIGFLLSASAALGVVAFVPPLARAITPRTGSAVATAVAVPLAAQVAVAPMALTVFGRMPAVGMICNLVATPVAGAVMLVGLPLAVVSSMVPDPVAAAVMTPVSVMVRWVWWVAHAGARAPGGPEVDVAGWLAMFTLVALWGRGRVRDLG